ncbi:uncharacterized protein [Nicotiana tomentosiformis]|uniref:uncharacterized protein n=1 Tax=Nicotiana tomentosiformis TaxID=4098 RepID=UPI00388C7665
MILPSFIIRERPIGEILLALDVQALANMFVRMDILEPSVSRSSLFERIKARQYDNPYFLVLRDTAQHGDAKEVTIDDDDDDGVKYEHQRLGGLLQRLYIPAWKWERITMNFVVGLPRTLRRFDIVWVIVDRLPKSAHFIPFMTTYSLRDARLLGTNLVYDALEKVKLIRERLCTAQSRQKSYADTMARDVAYMVGEKVLLRVSRMKGVMRFGDKGKLSPRYVGPFEVLERVGVVSYRHALPPSLLGFNPVHHVSMIRKYYEDLSYVLDFSKVPLDGDLTYDVESMAILDRQV